MLQVHYTGYYIVYSQRVCQPRLFQIFEFAQWNLVDAIDLERTILDCMELMIVTTTEQSMYKVQLGTVILVK